MIIKQLDYLSPKITLFFQGNHRHSSLFSGIITILSYLTIFACIIYYTFEFIDRGNPTIYFFNRYVKDAGIFPLNSSAIFHYLYLITTSRIRNLTIDFKSISIYGIQKSLENYINHYDLSENTHWEYGYCHFNPNDINYKKIINLIDNNEFSQSACIEKYYNSTERRYYNINEPGFVWPTLEHGASNSNRTLYGIIIEKCNNNSVKNTCNNQEIVNEYFKRYGIALNFIDHYADVLNYKEPFLKYIYTVSNGLNSGTTVSYNNLNFNPSLTRTHNGFFLENLVEEKSYSFTQNEKITLEQEKKSVIVAFYFWMQNNMIYNERYYKKFQDVLSSIGGLGSFILLIGVFINSFFSYYVILIDTQELVFRIEKLNFNKKKKIKNPITLIKLKDEKYLAKINKNNLNTEDNNNNFNSNNRGNTNKQSFLIQNSNYPLFMNDYIKKENDEPFKLNIINIKNNNKRRKFSCYQSLRVKKFEESKRIEQIDKWNYNSDGEIQKDEIKRLFFEIKNCKKKEIYKPSKKHNFTWCSYFLYILLLKNKNNKIKFYENFRAQILSEENLVQNNLDIYKLLEICKIKKTNPFEVDKNQQIIC